MSLVNFDDFDNNNSTTATVTTETESNKIILHKELDRDEVLRKLLETEANSRCFDCDKKHPAWASSNNAVFLCIECCGKHRCYGVHVSFIRSVTLDNWKKEHLASMMCGGNERLRQYVAERPQLAALRDIAFYSHAEMERYRKMIFLESRACLGIDGQKELADKEADRLKWQKVAEERKSQGLNSSSISSSSSMSSSSVPQPYIRQKTAKEPTCCGCF